MPQLNQIIAIEKGVKSRATSELTTLHKAAQKTDPFYGFTRTYRSKNDEGETYPPEMKKARLNSKDVLKRVSGILTELFDVTATKDWANCDAKADVMVDGQPLVKQVPVTYLLFLEKQITDVRTFINKMPTLDENEDWLADPNSGLYKTQRTTTHKTRKEQRPVVLYDATPEHPAQTQLITEDILVGYWDTVKFSGAIPVPRKQELLERVDKLLRAVKFAREEANSVEVTDQKVGEAVFGYLFS